MSRIIVKSTSFPSKGTTREVGGMISASSRKNTVRERRMLMERLTCNTAHVKFRLQLPGLRIKYEFHHFSFIFNDIGRTLKSLGRLIVKQEGY